MSQQNNSPSHGWGALWPLGEALRFLTILPTPGMPPMSEEGIGRGLPFFPLAGLVVGGLLVAAGAMLGLLWDDAVRAVGLVVMWGVITAGLHLDGLSDTFDGVMSWRSRERKLEIMRDSRIGAMGALALAAVLGLKVALLAGAGDAWWTAVLLAPVLGRWADVYGIVVFPPAREGGLGKSFQQMLGPRHFAFATGTALVLALAIGGVRGLLALLLVWAAAHALGRWWTNDLGGLTGDTYGAMCEIGEVVALATLTALV
jgi:adenosylcobinamide-GDP ribazoletransferase